ncbi:MAG TPA: hypothetical protein VGK16_05925 [Candidatus Limnocylindrales bacterium]
MSSRAAAIAIAIVALAAAACTGAGGTTAGGATPEPTTAPSPSIDGLAHPTGAGEIVLRFDESGGFVPPEFLAAHVPQFTLYGDGTVVFVQSSSVPPSRAEGITTGQSVRTARLTEDQVQALLEFAIRDGGLGTARAEYQNPLVADAPTAVFTLNADGASRTVSVVALGMEDQEVTADTATKQALARLGSRLRDFDAGGTLQSATYEAAAYRGVLQAQDGVQGVAIRDWPWTDLAPADFRMPSDPNVLQQGKATLTPQQAATLGVEGFESGLASGVFLRDTAGKVYSFVLRPLLPDERA